MDHIGNSETSEILYFSAWPILINWINVLKLPGGLLSAKSLYQITLYMVSRARLDKEMYLQLCAIYARALRASSLAGQWDVDCGSQDKSFIIPAA